MARSSACHAGRGRKAQLSAPHTPVHLPGMTNRLPFVAIDFETADPHRDSACRAALVRVERGRIVAKADRLIRPPRSKFWFPDVHGITWDQVRREPDFAGVWPALRPLADGAAFFVAHNAPFGRGVLEACLDAHGLPRLPLPFLDTLPLFQTVMNRLAQLRVRRPLGRGPAATSA